MATDVPLAGPDALKTHVTEGFAAAAGRLRRGRHRVLRPGRALAGGGGPGAGWRRGCWTWAAAKARSSIPAAQAAGPRGHVTGIDLAAPMLAHAKERARAAGLANVRFTEGDAEDPGTYPGLAAGKLRRGAGRQRAPVPAPARAGGAALVRPAHAGRHVGVAWTVAQEPAWVPVIAAVDAHVPDGVPAFGAFMRRPPFDAIGAVEAMLTRTGYQQVATTTRQVTVTYDSPEQWWATYQTQGPWALSWRHIPPDRLAQAKRDAFALLELSCVSRTASLTRTLTFAFTTGRRPA